MRISPYLLSGGAVFLGAFLLFAIQPLAGKQLLPLFGGSSSVWATSLVFFTGALFLGYVYVYVVTRFERATQVYVHVSFAALAALAALTHLVSPSSFTFTLGGSPAVQVLATLFLTIGAPFLLLATTGPLMQYWYGMKDSEEGTKKEPYTLYALSNAASFLALLSYPFLVEPFSGLSEQHVAWMLLFLVYVGLVVVNAMFYFRTSITPVVRAVTFTLGNIAAWVALAALPTFMLVAVTTKVTQQVAPVPLLWVVPLALYLLTFIIAFAGRGQSVFTPLLFLMTASWAWWLTPAPYDQIVLQVLAYLVLLFFCGLCCHVMLYRMRPIISSSPLFYVWVSFGGALGTFAASILAPLMFTDFYEFPIALALGAALAVWILPLSFFPRIITASHAWITKMLFIGLVIAPLMLFVVLEEEEGSYIATRNFYGNARVIFGEELISLRHGTTLHGTQLADPADALLPTSYYTPGSGLGRSILYAQRAQAEEGIRVGTIGLGTGTIAAYCRDDDVFVFYEIDSRIESIARTYFSYVSRCEDAEVRLGDGRLVLERELARGSSGQYDVLAIDAFSDDSIPVHLLTFEAFQTYVAHLREPDGLLVVHISNRYLDLDPVVFRIAAELGLNAMLIDDSGESGVAGSSSSWVVLSREQGVFTSPAFANADSPPPYAAEEIWTDDYSSLVPVVDVALPWE